MTQHYDTTPPETDHDADVLVIGGGPAGAWAALTAASHGARAVLADKGFLGTSGATAPANTGVWYAPPDRAHRDSIVKRYWDAAGDMADRSWIDRVLDLTFERVNQLAEWGYRFPNDANGHPYRSMLRGPDYMRFMRRQVSRAGVRILDQSPALELLTSDGVVAGAAGVSRQSGNKWRVRAGAVVIATGGCAFLSNSLGCNVLTGDGYLMAAEVGALLSGMEFSSQYGPCPAETSLNKQMPFNWATFWHEDGTEISVEGVDQQTAIARVLIEGSRVYASFNRASRELADAMRKGQPNVFLPHDRLGIDPFVERFPVGLRFEGTVRGTGGIDVDLDCASAIPGLYAAGDAASRERLVGASTGGGSPNAAWAISSGAISGTAAARFAATLGVGFERRTVRPAGAAGLRPRKTAAHAPDEIIQILKSDVVSLERNFFRNAASLREALDTLAKLWSFAADHLTVGDGRSVRARETAAMVATARWMYESALSRRETRGMHRRTDFRATDGTQRRRLRVGGLDDVHVEASTDQSVRGAA
jgi:succinate dehydrogenase/fumarate reductase flavoprotein subunit